jgi:hypothetical protein
MRYVNQMTRSISGRIRGTKTQEMEIITATLYSFIQLEDSKCKGANRL